MEKMERASSASAIPTLILRRFKFKGQVIVPFFIVAEAFMVMGLTSMPLSIIYYHKIMFMSTINLYFFIFIMLSYSPL